MGPPYRVVKHTHNVLLKTCSEDNANESSSVERICHPGRSQSATDVHICWFGDGVDAVVMWNNTVSGPVQFDAKMLHAFRSKEKIYNCCLWQSVWHVSVVAVADM